MPALQSVGQTAYKIAEALRPRGGSGLHDRSGRAHRSLEIEHGLVAGRVQSRKLLGRS